MKKILLTFLAGIIWNISYSQDIQSIMKDDIPQAEQLIEAYFTPMSESFGAGLNNGWYNTAKPHKIGGFDVTFTLNTVIIPNTAEVFNIKAVSYTHLRAHETDQ